MNAPTPQNVIQTMIRTVRTVWLAAILLAASTAVIAQDEPVDLEAIEFFRAEGLGNSQVMDVAWWLTDVHGPRLTASPNLQRAQEWAVSRFGEWGIDNARREAWGEFGRGWSLERFSMHATGSVSFPVIAHPKAWSAGVDGRVSADVVILDIDEPSDLERYRGQVAGKFVLLEAPREIEPWFTPPANRRGEDELQRLASATRPDQNVRQPSRGNVPGFDRTAFEQERLAFLFEEGALAILDRNFKGDGGTVFITAANLPIPRGTDWTNRPRVWHRDAPHVVPQITLAVEHYNRIYRLVEAGIPVTLEMELNVTYHDESLTDYNVFAEIPGTDPEIADEIVMLGAHFDSWHAGTGATDNAAGSSVVMEAMRILNRYFEETGTRPRRTIRAALWSGEEQGLHGSRQYVARTFAQRSRRGETVTPTDQYDLFSAYYNFDNGTGRIRGVFTQGNEAVEPIFRAWLEPLQDLDAGTVTILNTGSTDHVSFDAVGLPGFQFVQDPIAYSSTTHHSNMDTFDHLVAEDLQQAAVVMATFVFHTTQRDERLPRKSVELSEAR